MELAIELAKLLKDGGPWAAMSIMLAAWFFERRENRMLQKSILELVTAQTAALVKVETSLATLKEVFTSFLSHRGDK